MEEPLSTPLTEQDNFKELLRLLDEKGLHEEKGQVIHLADYIDNMDQQFGKVLKELQAVKHQVKGWNSEDSGRPCCGQWEKSRRRCMRPKWNFWISKTSL